MTAPGESSDKDEENDMPMAPVDTSTLSSSAKTAAAAGPSAANANASFTTKSLNDDIQKGEKEAESSSTGRSYLSTGTNNPLNGSESVSAVASGTNINDGTPNKKPSFTIKLSLKRTKVTQVIPKVYDGKGEDGDGEPQQEKEKAEEDTSNYVHKNEKRPANNDDGTDEDADISMTDISERRMTTTTTISSNTEKSSTQHSQKDDCKLSFQGMPSTKTTSTTTTKPYPKEAEGGKTNGGSNDKSDNTATDQMSTIATTATKITAATDLIKIKKELEVEEEEGEDSKSLDDRFLSEVITSGKEPTMAENATDESGSQLGGSASNTTTTLGGNSTKEDISGIGPEGLSKGLGGNSGLSSRAFPSGNSSLLSNNRESPANTIGTGSGGPTTAAPAAATTLTNSFLDSLSEDQRRVRTRHLPGATGFRKLHKSEIKRDMMLVKAMIRKAKSGVGGSGGSSSGALSPGKSNGSSMDDSSSRKYDTSGDMDVDNKTSVHGSDDESPSDDELGNNIYSKSRYGDDMITRQAAFALPRKDTNVICSESEEKSMIPKNGNNNVTTNLSSNNNKSNEKDILTFIKSPQVVQRIMGFNPPRPSESVGPKKMHRLQRWERNPQDVEGDMNTYRKTVERTRQELHKTELERERIEVIGAHARNHYLKHFKAIREEVGLLNENLNATQIEGVEAAGLLTSKTRSRGVGRGATHAMRDVISILKSRGEKLDFSSDLAAMVPEAGSWCKAGIGGVCSDDSSFSNGWILPGEKVTCPYGNGIVLNVFGSQELDVNTPLEGSDLESRKDGNSAVGSNLTTGVTTSNTGPAVILPPRICVRLPFGIGYFVPEVISSNENPSSYSDAQLGKRWKAMLETAKKMGSSIDTKSLEANLAEKDRKLLNGKRNDGNSNLTEGSAFSCTTDNDDVVMGSGESASLSGNKKRKADTVGKIVPFGAGTLPTPSFFGGDLDCLSLDQVEKNIDVMQNFRSGVLGRPSNPAVPQGYKDWERQRCEVKTLRGTVLQLRNKVYRQRRFRMLNERNCALSKERRNRFEVLLFEMKADLNSLKERLNEELDELGIDQEQAESLLEEYYSGEKDSGYLDEEDSNKRKNEEIEEKTSRRKLEMLPDTDMSVVPI